VLEISLNPGSVPENAGDLASMSRHVDYSDATFRRSIGFWCFAG